jgi:hypothetical protein
MIIFKSSGGLHIDCNMVYDKSFIEYNHHCAIAWTHGYQTPSHVSKVGVESKEELFFKYFEPDSPYERLPFVDKVCSSNNFKANFLSIFRNCFFFNFCTLTYMHIT